MVNIKTIKVSLSDKGLDDLIGRLTLLKYGLKEADDKIVKEMAEFVKEQVANNLAETPFKDGNNATEAYSFVNGNKAEAGMRGRQSVYNEFGTGTEGLNTDPPYKNRERYGLKDYNSGPKIDPDTGVWWYYSDEKGKVVPTTGIPAGKQVFKANEELQNVKLDKIKEKVGEVISKL